MLYCVAVEKGRISAWGTKTKVSPRTHRVWDVKDEDELHEHIWQERCNYTDGAEVYSSCNSCGSADHDIWDDCPKCGSCDVEVEEEEWGEAVERETDFHYELYDPSNPDHALCKGEEDKRPEHKVATRKQKIEKTRGAISRLQWSRDRQEEELKALVANIRNLDEKIKAETLQLVELLGSDV